MEEFCAFDML
jgi:hypothetical protein